MELSNLARNSNHSLGLKVVILILRNIDHCYYSFVSSSILVPLSWLMQCSCFPLQQLFKTYKIFTLNIRITTMVHNPCTVKDKNAKSNLLNCPRWRRWLKTLVLSNSFKSRASQLFNWAADVLSRNHSN